MIHINVAEEKNSKKPVTKVRFSPLKQQFSEVDSIFEELRELVKSGDYTLGKPVEEFELLFAKAVGAKYAIGVGTGTDSLKIPLKALGVGPGDEVLTAANTCLLYTSPSPRDRG